MTKSENEELLELLKEKDVSLKDLLLRVYDLNTRKEGWISAEQMLRRFIDEN